MSRRLILPVLLAASAGGLALAQAPAPDQAALAAARREAREATLRSTQLEQAAAEAGSEAERLRAQADALVAGIEASEANVSAAQAELRILGRRRARQDARLAERQQPVMRLTAGLQALARRPPVLALVQPGSVADAARLRALLAATLPVVHRRTAALRVEIAAARTLQAEARQAVRALAQDRSELASRRAALARLEELQRRRADALAGSALRQSDRAIAFDEEARDISGRTAGRAFQAGIDAGLAAMPAPLPRPGSAARPGGPPPYRMPVEGRLLTGFGEISPAGIHSRGLLIQTAADAAVIAPRPGTIAYAGRFRSYGEIIVIDHGGGWTTTITSLAALRVGRGDLVAAGDPIGRAGAGTPVGIELRRHGRPRPIAPFISFG